jgi:hypothetical protein
MFAADSTVTRDEFQECIDQAREGLLLSDWTPWEDTDEALEAIATAAAMGDVPQELIDAAWEAYGKH